MIEEDLKDIHYNCSLHREPKKKMLHIHGYHFKLGEVVNNGIKYFGQQKRDKDRVTALFICHCGTAWHCRITSIISGATASCGCTNGKKFNRIDDV